MNQPNLRKLAREYAEGSLPFKEYRRARTELIQSILEADNTDTPLTQANYTAPMADEDSRTETLTATARTLSSTRIVRDLPPEPAPQPIKVGTDWRIPTVAGAIIILLLLIVIALLLFGGNESAIDETSDTVTPIESATTTLNIDDPDNQAIAMLQSFTAAPRWDQDTLDTFVEEWLALPQEQRDTALESTASRRLADLLNRQLVEERALRSADSEILQMIEERTLRFAAQLGLQDRRLQDNR